MKQQYTCHCTEWCDRVVRHLSGKQRVEGSSPDKTTLKGLDKHAT